MTTTTTRSIKNIYSYATQAMEMLKEDHPHYEEIKKLLAEQINDELETYAHSRAN